MTATATAPNMRGTLLAPPPTSARARKQWLAARRQVIGASEVATILGMAPDSWGTSPLQVWLEKTDPDHVADDPSERMLWGLRLERPIADEYRVRHAKQEGVYVAPSPGLLASEDHPWLGATPDRVLLDRETRTTALGLVEIKTNAWSLEREWADGPPDYYQIQAQVQMGVTGLPFVDLVPLFGGNRMPEPHRVEFDPEAWAQIVEITGQFWFGNVVERVPPEPMVRDLSHLPQVWPGRDDASATVPHALVEQLRQRDKIKARITQLEDAAARVELRLKATMGDAKVAYYQPPQHPDAIEAPEPVKVATWSRYPVGRFQQKAFAADHPDLVKQYTTTGSGQRLTVAKTIHDLEEEQD